MPRPICRLPPLVLLCLVTACANQAGRYGRTQPTNQGITRYYPPPGPPDDPWGPYVTEAARRFQLPERWIRQVMRQESGGQSDAVSSAGAMGLMQVMPATYDILRRRYGLGDDSFDPHNNMLAGAAYLREMYDRYGSPGFLAAYNAGPGRVDSYLAGGNPLPDETVNYLASIAPRLGNDVPPSGPLAVYAAGSVPADLPPPRSDGCDPDAAYDPDRVCPPPPQVVLAVAAAPLAATQIATAAAPAAIGGFCDPDAAYDPTQPCRPAPAPIDPPPAIASSAIASSAIASSAIASPAIASPIVVSPIAPPPIAPPPIARPPVAAVPLPQPRYQLATAWPPPGEPGWAIQVGAFVDPATARAATDRARHAAPDLLTGARIALPPTTPFGGAVLYRARLGALSSVQAAQSCARLTAVQLACMVVPPTSGF